MAMGRNCTVCGGNGHNDRTCSEKGKSIKLFGVEITTTTTTMSKKDCIGRKIKKGNPWTEDEQRAFLKGLGFHGKGNWAKIAKDFLPSRTSTQIASHAQKYFMRLDADSDERKKRKKPSVFDLHLEKTEDTKHAIVPLENNQETHYAPRFLPNYMIKVPTPKVLPLTWVYMYPYHQYASTSASATTFDKPLTQISSSSSSSFSKDNLELTL